METIGNEKYAFLCEKFYCDNCHYGTSKKSSFKNHCESKKHKNTILSTNGNENYAKLCSTKYHCENCNKNFKDRSGLWKHKKKCNYTEEKDDSQFIDGINIKDKDALVIHLLKQNSDLQNKIIDMASKSTITNNTNNSHNNNNNKTFNLQFFLNETCKNAMNITDFVSSIKMDLDDLEHTGRTDYVEGISNIVVKNLNNLEQQLRPLHCSDFKREVLYIKDNDEWLKETDNKPILTKAIKTIANENIKQINKWVQNYPDCIAADSKKNDLYLKIVSNSMNGLTKEEADKNIHKIITNVAKNVTIEK
jgi:hypothetical protein